MSGDVHVRFCEGLGVRFPRATRRNIFVRRERAGHRVMNSVRRFIECRLRLLVNDEKSKVAPPEEVRFPWLSPLCGSRWSGGGSYLGTHQRANGHQDWELTPRNCGHSVAACITELNRYLDGWFGYFRICTTEGAALFWRFDAHIRRRLRAIIVRQKKRPRYLFRHLVQRGVSEQTAMWSARKLRSTIGAWPSVRLWSWIAAAS